MKTNKNGLDEMQRGKRDNIGNQMFMLMFYALLLDSGLYGAGVRWLAYPVRTMVIIMGCMAVYLIRTIVANAYLPPKAQARKTSVFLALTIVLSVVLAIAAFHLFGNLAVRTAAEDTDDHSALILFIVSTVSLLISLTVAIIKKVTDKNIGND